MKARVVRAAIFSFGLGLLISGAVSTARRVMAADEPAAITISTSAAQPREIEDQTRRGLEKQYALAWQNLGKALESNRADLLDAAFTGAARDEFAGQIDQANKDHLATRLEARGHKVEAVFYSPDGTAIQLHDTAQLEITRLADGKQILSETREQKYVVLMTLVEDKWKVRVLQEAE